ncbi:PilZ domain-containing protein [Jannaschia faecimaris]|uniref:PilZ domain-containing protein n=1 Tax=Jannaschia faecimaris TaxID=1244108 RepID=A0A1H3NYC8_9RHOB|nr:PilZ domain-containing protein [Jannaschia faecimaris]SDY93720.1 PilZ domain-containing protein [Jannaschia faecimaris]
MQYRSRRIPSDSDITLIISGLKLTVRLLDVSETGLKVALAQAFPSGTAVTVQAARFDLSGIVRWSTEKETGILLSGPLKSDQQAELAGMSWAA